MEECAGVLDFLPLHPFFFCFSLEKGACSEVLNLFCWIRIINIVMFITSQLFILASCAVFVSSRNIANLASYFAIISGGQSFLSFFSPFPDPCACLVMSLS